MTVLDKMEALSDDLKAYFNTNVELVKLQALDRSSALGASVIAGLVIAMIFLMFAMLGSISAAIYIGVLLNSYALGFIIVAGFYLILGFVLLVSRKSSLVNPIRDAIISKALEDEDEHQNQKH